MKFSRYSGVMILVFAVACSGGGGSTGPTGGTGGTGGGGGGGNCPANSVCMLTSSFTPATLTVAKGTTVEFVNNSSIQHTVNFDGTRPPGVADVPLNSSGTFPRTFNDAGTFDYHCTQHGGMTGTIKVQ